MLGLRATLLCLAVCLAAGLMPAASAVAANCGGSAGDTQYVDPLACGGGSGLAGGGAPANRPAGAGTGRPTTSVSGVSTTSAGSPTATVSSASATATTAASSPTATTSSSPSSPSSAGASGAQDLPYTGFDARTLLVLGIGLLGAGVLTRWMLGRRSGG